MPLQRLPARGLLLLLLTLVLLPASPTAAQDSSWEGNAAVVRSGEFASPGLFAASNSFPQGTLLQVENPQNGKAVQVTVVDRIDGRSNVFLLLSEQAAAVLGLPPSEVIRVKARVLIASIDTSRPGTREPTASADQDVNPAAAVPPEALKPAAPAPAATSAQPEPAAPAAPALPREPPPRPKLPCRSRSPRRRRPFRGRRPPRRPPRQPRLLRRPRRRGLSPLLRRRRPPAWRCRRRPPPRRLNPPSPRRPRPRPRARPPPRHPLPSWR
jgi:hypothetical protein